MIALILATRMDVPKDFSKSTLIGASFVSNFRPPSDINPVASCPVIRNVQLGEADRGSLRARRIVIVCLLRCDTFHGAPGAYGV